MAEKVIIECSMETARIIARACEFLMRMRNGQYDELSWEMKSDPHKHAQDFGRDAFDHVMLNARTMVFPDLWGVGHHYGVHHDHTGDNALDVYEVIRHAIAMYEHPEGGHTVDFHEPMGWGSEPLPQCRIEVTKDV